MNGLVYVQCTALEIPRAVHPPTHPPPLPIPFPSFYFSASSQSLKLCDRSMSRATNSSLASLRSSLFRFLLAGESDSQGDVSRRRRARAKSQERVEGVPPPPPLPLIFFCYVSPVTRATPACLKGNGKDCYAG